MKRMQKKKEEEEEEDEEEKKKKKWMMIMTVGLFSTGSKVHIFKELCTF